MSTQCASIRVKLPRVLAYLLILAFLIVSVAINISASWALPEQNPAQQTVPTRTPGPTPECAEDCAAKPGVWKPYTEGCPEGYTCEGYYTYECKNASCVLKDTPDQRRKRCSASAPWVSDPIDPATGEFVLSEVDLALPGRGIDFQFVRLYSSAGTARTPLGYNWDHSYNVYVRRPATGTLILSDGPANAIAFHRGPDGIYRSFLNYYGVLSEEPDGAIVSRSPEGLTGVFWPLDGSPSAGKLRRVTDLNDNALELLYDDAGRLAAVIDTLGRPVFFNYDPAGYLAEVVDALGRRVIYEHNVAGDLVAVTRPAGDGQPATTRYTYATGTGRPALDHNLLTITQPNETALDPDGPPAVINIYGTDPARRDFDRVIQQIANFAGAGCCGLTSSGSVTLTYELLDPEAGIGQMNAARSRTTIHDSSGHVTEYDFNAAGAPVRTAQHEAMAGRGLAALRVTTYTYNHNAEQTSVTAPDGSQQRMTYNDRAADRRWQGQVLTDEQRPAPAIGGPTLTKSFAYDPLTGRVAREVNPAGAVTHYTYDAHGNRLAVTDALGGMTTFAYDAHGEKLISTDALGHASRWQTQYLAPPSAAFTVSSPAGWVTDQFTLDASASADLADTPAELRFRWDFEDDGVYDTPYTHQRIAIHQYPSFGQWRARLEVLDTDALTATATSLIHVRPRQLYLPLITRRYSWRPFALYLPIVWADRTLTTATYAASATYNPAPQVVAQAAGGRAAAAAVSQHSLPSTASPVYQRTVVMTDTLGNPTINVYDAYGNLLAATDANGNTTAYGYNALNQLVVITDALGFTTRYEYDLNGNRARLTNALGHVTSSTYDLAGRLITETDPAGGVTTYTYDALGRKISRTDPNGHQTRYAYDALGRLVSETDPLGGQTVYAYNLAGQRAAVTDPLGAATRYFYDGLGRLLERVDAEGYRTAWAYDAMSNTVAFTDAVGAVTRTEYDALGRALTITNGLGGVTSYRYDALGRRISMRDALGRVTDYVYDAGGRMTRLLDAAGGVTHYGYDLVGNQITTTDPDGRTTCRAYDALNRMISQADGAGGTETFAYDAVGNRISRTDPLGNRITYAYDPLRRLVAETTPLGQRAAYVYDAAGNQIEKRDSHGHVETYIYDAADRLIEVRDALSQTVAYAYDAVGNRIAITDTAGVVTRYTFDRLHRRTREDGQTGAVTRYGFDGLGHTVAITDASGRLTYQTYDALGRRLTILQKANDQTPAPDADDALTAFEYDAVGNVLTVTEPDGVVTRFTYDVLNRAETKTDGAGQVTRRRYDGAGHEVQVEEPGGRRTTYAYDLAGRMIQVSDTVGILAAYSYDPASRQIAATDGNGLTTRRAFDALGRQVAITDPLGAATRFDLDLAGNLLATTDANGQTSRIAYDALDRRAVVTDALGLATHYTYDARGDLASITDARGNTTRYTRDVAGRLTAVTYADGSQRAYTYDGVGRQLTRTDGNGATTHYLYDALGRLAQRDYPDGPDDILTYNLAGRLLTAERDGWRVTQRYDGAGRLIESAQADQTVRYAYAADGRARSLLYPSGRMVTETLDARGRLAEISDGAPTALAAFTYDGNNRLTARTFRNGVLAQYAYDAANRLITLTAQSAAQNLLSYTYQYDAVGDRTVADDLNAANQAAVYRHDPTHQLISHKTGVRTGNDVPAPTREVVWQLDPAGNWQQVTVNGAAEVRAHGANNELTVRAGQPFRYDGNGNLIADSVFTYTYDYEDRLTALTRIDTGVVVAAYRYDAMGRRVSKVTTAGETRFAYDDWLILEERDVTHGQRMAFVWGPDMVSERYLGGGIGGLVAISGTAQVWYALADAAGNTTLLVDAHTGTAAGAYAYDSFGALLASSGLAAGQNPFRYATKYADSESGLVYFGGRYYSPALGRWITRDPVQEGEAGPEATNLYWYVRNSPLHRVDPYGLESCWGGSVSSFSIGAGGPLGPIDASFSVNGSLKYTHCKKCCTSGAQAGRYVTDDKLEVSINGSGSLTGRTYGFKQKIGLCEAQMWIGLRVSGSLSGSGGGALTSDRCNDIELAGQVCFSGSGGFSVSGGAAAEITCGWVNLEVGAYVTGSVGVQAQKCYQCGGGSCSWQPWQICYTGEVSVTVSWIWGSVQWTIWSGSSC